MDDVFVLDVRLDRLRRWYTDGLLCLGDAAHAMTPVGGVGINLAIQDAVAATRLLAAPLREHRLTTADLARVQQHGQRPAVILQTMQRTIHLGIGPLLSGRITVCARPGACCAWRRVRRNGWCGHHGAHDHHRR
jgi:2-polyprenyl-6-methoxyphenol hydroxylase-like FAD-dependent oxidoreductase